MASAHPYADLVAFLTAMNEYSIGTKQGPAKDQLRTAPFSQCERLHNAIVRLTAEFLSPGHPGAVEPKMPSTQDSESQPMKKTQRDRRV